MHHHRLAPLFPRPSPSLPPSPSPRNSISSPRLLPELRPRCSQVRARTWAAATAAGLASPSMDSNNNPFSSLMASLHSPLASLPKLLVSAPNPLATDQGPYSLNTQAIRANSKASHPSNRHCNHNSLVIPVKLHKASNNRRRNSRSKQDSRISPLQLQHRRRRRLRNSDLNLRA